jgi:hypothetical protein
LGAFLPQFPRLAFPLLFRQSLQHCLAERVCAAAPPATKYTEGLRARGPDNSLVAGWEFLWRRMGQDARQGACLSQS